MMNVSVYRLGEKLVEFRKINKLTQRNVEQMTDIPQPRISFIERGALPLIWEERKIRDLLECKNKKFEDMIKDKKIGSNLKRLITMNGYTESTFARLSGLAKDQILDIENGNISLIDPKNKFILNKITVTNLFKKDDLFRGINVMEDENGETKSLLHEQEEDFIDILSDKIANKLSRSNEAFSDKNFNKLLSNLIDTVIKDYKLSEDEINNLTYWKERYLDD